VERASGKQLELDCKRLPKDELEIEYFQFHDRTGDTLQLLPLSDQPQSADTSPADAVAYLKLSTIKVAEIEGYISQIQKTHGLVIDIRSYPSEFVVFELGERLVREPTQFALFTKPDLANPGAFSWTEPTVLTPRQPSYHGKVVILVDETSQSQAEYTAMALRTAPGALVLGSTTAGADGNISSIPLPGGLRSMISGIGVFYPDKAPTQRIGIVPDVVVSPTIAGMREGRDEVLEQALRVILGDEIDDETIRRMAAP
jgi:C-terminal processing protease CtpA/Prc